MDIIPKDPQLPALWTLLYADDMMLAAKDKAKLERQLQAWQDWLGKFRLHLNMKKTEYMTMDQDIISTILIDGLDLPMTNAFEYLGSMTAANGSHSVEAITRVNATWLKW
uniref:Reverse transcriptase domain-containing protein n=1 Tax=Plectus sambesii TaxID=2011161 RepID=A0A914V8P4_9BILA